MVRKKILIIDDTELVATMVKDTLCEESFEVLSANNGAEGLKMVAAHKPDLVLLDIVMPGMDGFEVCRLLREDEANHLMPIIMLTAQCDQEDRLTGLELGADDYILKPFNPKELVYRVQNTLARVDRNRLANPLTGLPGNIEIHREINDRIDKKGKTAVIYLDADNFKAYNDFYGFARGDQCIKMIAGIIVRTAYIYGTEDDFIGHIGGDDFVIITNPGKADTVCERIIKEFDEKIPQLYDEADRRRGYICTLDRKRKTTRFPMMTMSAAIVTNEKRDLDNHLQVGEIAAQLKEKAKSIKGSIYLKDKRTG